MGEINPLRVLMMLNNLNFPSEPKVEHGTWAGMP